jgi:AcrR family transcriptional regulator
MMTDVQQRILQAANDLFTERGYQEVTLRQIADKADVKASIIIRHFDSKENLLLHCMHNKKDKKDLFKGPIKGMGERIVSELLDSISDKSSPTKKMDILLQAISSQHLKNEMLKTIRDSFTKPLLDILQGEDKEVRAALIASQISGLLLHIDVLGDPDLIKSNKQKLVKHFGSSIQALLDNK